MKILRVFDSLKFLRTIFVAIACAFFIFPAHAELQDTELPVGYKRLTGLKLESASIKITDFYLTGNDTLRFRAKSSAASNWIGSYTTSSADNNYSFYAHMSTTGKYARYNGQTGGSGVSSNTWYSVVMSPNGVSGVRNPSSWTPSNFTCSVPLYIGNMGEGKLVPAPDVSFSGNIVVDGRLTLIPCERESDGVMGYYSLQHNSFFTSNIGTITSLGYDTSHMVEISTQPTSSTLPAGYTELEYLESTGEQYIELSFGFDPTDMIRAKFAVQGQANDKYIVAPKVWNSNNNRFGMGVHLAYYAVGYGNQQTSTTILQPSINNNNQFHEWVYSGYVFSIPELNTSKDVSNITFGTTTSNIRLFYGYQGGTAGKISYYKHIKANGTSVELIPARRNSDGVLGMYDLADSNPATAFHTNAGTGNFIAGEYKIKIATTHYNETKFAPVETNLETARTTINNLITQMQTNAVNVSKLAMEKQTRPNATCPAGKNCLLVTDPTGAENWYVIAGADAVQSSSNVPDYFSFTTTELNAGDSMSFSLTPSGTFTVDWGDGTTPQIIERTNTTSETYSHSYSNAGPKTIKITGRATGYSTNTTKSVFIVPYPSSEQVLAIDGSLGAIFPTLGNGTGQQPSFYEALAYTKITSIPEHLFDGVTGAADEMFEYTFSYTPVESIPENLFSGITGSALSLFDCTFCGCEKITRIPAGLFRGVHGAANWMFGSTFSGTKITSIPPHLFDGVTGAADSMFNSTFSRTQITSIPAGLFSGITGAAPYMFSGTFANCPNLTGYIPESTFAGLIQNNSPDADEFMSNIFNRSTGLATACPQNTTEVSTPYKSEHWETGNGNYAVMCRPN